MNALLKVPYELAWRAANAVAPLVPPSGNKVLRTLRSRVDLLSRIDEWAGAHRDPARALLWMHASSVGESLQALPVLNLFRERNRDIQVVFTFYSPSAESATRKFPADFVTYLPFDTTGSMRHVVETLKPSALVFSKLDVWPTLVSEARMAGVKMGIVSATLRANSARRSRLASLLLRDAYATIDLIGAIAEKDRANILELGAGRARITVTGDTRFDQVWARSHEPPPTELLDHLRSTRPTIVAGSTWKSDEAPLLEAFIETKKAHNRVRLIVAPHEPDVANISSLTLWAKNNGLTCALLDDPHAGAADIVVVDRVGVLGDLYALADIAYVGGGFHRPGLHSVLEPAAFGKPVVFGRRFANSRDAELLVAHAAAKPVESSRELAMTLCHWLANSSARMTAGTSAAQVVQSGLGAAEASYELVASLMHT